MPAVKVILNPSSGRGLARSATAGIARAFERVGLSFDLALTEGPGHATLLAEQTYREQFDVVVAAGGDGTVHEVINGLLTATDRDLAPVKLAVLPLGSGNDFAHMVGCPRDLDRAAMAIDAGQIRRVDVGHTIIVTDSQAINRYFGNNMGIGFEARVTLESYNVARLRGLALYLVATLRALRGYDSFYVDITCTNDDGSEWVRSGPIFLITIGNSPRAGGGIYLTPQAKMDDGVLDVGVMDPIPVWRAVTLLFQILLRRHANDPVVTMRRATSIEVDCPAGVPIQLDGEVLAKSAKHVKVVIERRRLQVVIEG